MSGSSSASGSRPGPQGATWARAPGVLSRHTVGRVLLLPPAAPAPLELGGTGVLVWDLLATPRSARDLVAALAERFGAAADDVARDVEPVLRELERLGAVRCAP